MWNIYDKWYIHVFKINILSIEQIVTSAPHYPGHYMPSLSSGNNGDNFYDADGK